MVFKSSCVVCCSAASGTTTVCNDHTLCAERRLLSTALRAASRRGVPSHALVRWVRKQLGGGVTVHRRTHGDTKDGVSLPCLLCARQLDKFQLHWSAFDGARWVTDETNTTPLGWTSGQRRRFHFL